MLVLMVEDDPLQRLVREQQIQTLGFECTSCMDAETALAAYRQTFRSFHEEAIMYCKRLVCAE